MDFPPLPRRRFLKACVAAGGAITLGSTAACTASDGTPATGHDTAVGRLLVLDARRAEILEAFADATLATGDGFPSVRDAGVIRRIDEELHYTDAAIRDDVLLAIDGIDWLPVAYGRFRRLRRLPAADRRAFLDGLQDTRSTTVRALVNGLRMITGLVYYAHRGTWTAMHYDGTHAGLPPRDDEQRAAYRLRTEGRA